MVLPGLSIIVQCGKWNQQVFCCCYCSNPFVCIWCWQRANLSLFFSCCPGNLSKTCTADGWTEMHPMTIAVNCGYNMNSTNEDDVCMLFYLFVLFVYYLFVFSFCLCSLFPVFFVCFLNNFPSSFLPFRSFFHSAFLSCSSSFFLSFILLPLTFFLEPISQSVCPPPLPFWRNNTIEHSGPAYAQKKSYGTWIEWMHEFDFFPRHFCLKITHVIAKVVACIFSVSFQPAWLSSSPLRQNYSTDHPQGPDQNAECKGTITLSISPPREINQRD